MSAQLKNPLASYRHRYKVFLNNLTKVRGLQPREHQLWKVMDTVAFQDTETALEVTLYNANEEAMRNGSHEKI